jgi:acetyltransferase
MVLLDGKEQAHCRRAAAIPVDLGQIRTAARLQHVGVDRNVLIRPVRAGDAAALGAFFAALSPQARRFRFQPQGAEMKDERSRFHTDIDCARHMAFVCEADGRIVGEARYVANGGTRSCEFAIAVADDWHHTGIAQRLMHALMRAARADGFVTMAGIVLAANRDMLDFVRELGFDAVPSSEDPAIVRIVKRL